MKVTNLDGITSNWKPRGKARANCSQLHSKARQILYNKFNNTLVLEEVAIYPQWRTILYLDFYIPLLNLAIEVNGEQHYKFIQQFHRSKINFFHSRRRDIVKKEWCDTNNITLITLNYNESEQEWENKLNG